MFQEISFLQVDPADLRLPVETSVNPQTGSAATSIGIPLTAGRNGFQPALSLAYSSGGGNSVFGMGWNLQGIPSVGLSLKDGYPEYDGTDKFSFGGQELIPWLEEFGGEWHPKISENTNFFISYYRTAVDASFTRFEKWKDRTNQKVHWRVHGTNNSVMVFGLNPDDSSKIFDPTDSNKIFQWLLEAQYDNMGNAIEYEFIHENYSNVDGSSTFERNRIYKGQGNAQKHLKRIRYGNLVPTLPNDSLTVSQHWLFEVVFDYGDHEEGELPQYSTVPDSWPARQDPFSSYIAGFEQRTYRLCQRILMFHHIEELGAGPTLIGSTELFHAPNPAGTTLASVGYTGFKRTPADSYETKSMPPVLFNYTTPAVGNSFQQAPEQSMANVPNGLNGLNYKWTDLYGEGLPGVLYESNDAWYYKPNLGGGMLGAQQKVAKKPSSGIGSYALSDFDGDGNLNLVVLQGRESGYFEYNRDQEKWEGFQSFTSAPHVRQLDTNTQLLDLTGDGRSDIVTTEEDRTIWYPSKGKEGFGSPLQIAKSISNGVSRAPTIGSYPMLDYFFADMNGSGLPDQVHVFNGKVEYWPNLGNGKFGAGIVMANAPQLDFDFELDASRMRLVDLDGSGTSDLIYLGRGELKYWINASGNQFVEGDTISGLPFIDNISSAQILDFLGDGTPCLVWSSALAMHADAPIHYLRLTNGIKPRLLISVENNMGLETQFHYGHSGRHYLRDRNSETPWMTKLPSHQTVVDRLETIDHVSNTRFNQLFEYHDGFFDGEERAFRGFCLVDQYDSEKYQASGGSPEMVFTDPVCVRTWYHNGAPEWQKKRRKHYYQHDSYSLQLKDFHIEQSSLGPDEFYDAVRSLAGQVLRSETYGLEAGKREENPFQISHTNYIIRRLQPKKGNHDSGFIVFQSEQLEINFEQKSDDPYITYSVNLEMDAYGIPIKQAVVAYPRIHADAKAEQQVYHLRAAKATVTHFDDLNRYEIGIPLQSQGFELQTDTYPDSGQLFTRDAMLDLFNDTTATPISFNERFVLPKQAKLLQWNRNLYWNDSKTDALPWGEVGSKILPHHQETACFNTAFLENALETYFDEDLLTDSFYDFHNGFWWQSGPAVHYQNPSQFYLPEKEIQPNAAFIEYAYDEYKLALVSTTAVLVDDSGTEQARNTTSALIDYHHLAPVQIEDANRNTSEVLYDPFGVVILSSVHGQLLSTVGNLELHGHGRLEDYILPTEIDFDRIVANPTGYLQESASFFYYELDTWEEHELPLRSIAIAREQWVHDGEGNYRPESAYQLNVTYQDGFARTIQSKTLVEAGPDIIQYDASGTIVLDALGEPELTATVGPRWRVSGHTVFNNKQLPVEQYEPYFSPKVAFETSEVLNTFGVSGQIEYDAVGREKEIRFADGTINKVVFFSWSTKNYDANDSIIGSPYESIHSPLLDLNSPEGSALQKSKEHNDTPVESYIDGLGQVFWVEEKDENDRWRINRTVFDALGNPKEIIDARGLTAFTYFSDMQGRVFSEIGMDAGPKWQFINALDQPVHIWDARNVHQKITYDSWGRVVQKKVDGALDMDHITERFMYGEDAFLTDAWQRNALGQEVETYDQAGQTRMGRFDLLGNVLEKDRRLLKDYRSIPDWTDLTTAVWMEGSPFKSRFQFDALGRPISQELSDATIRHTAYLQSGSVDQLRVSTMDGTVVDQAVVREQLFNARGQLKEMTLGNGVIQQYTYDPSNYRLKQKLSFRRATPALPAKQYQHINYTYDAVGNITHLIDTARPNATLLYGQPRVNQYTYDAFYHLIEAESRTHQALETRDYAHAPDADGFIKGRHHINLDNMALLGKYTRTYNYDLNGNMQSLEHRSGFSPGTTFRWGRDFWISPTSNRSLQLPVTNPETRFDSNGNLSNFAHLRAVDWNYQNQLTRAVIIDRPGDDTDDAEYYVYGADGQRVRKVSQRLDHGAIVITEKIYLDGCEIKRIRNVGSEPVLERFSSHFSDGGERIALMHRWITDAESQETDDITKEKFHYQLNDHLGSSAFELDGQGEIINYEEYFPFGGSSFVFGKNGQDVKLKDYRYSGKERDDITGFYYYGFRYYAPWLCRWLNPDPIGPEDALNIYQFVHNNPVNEVDLDGLQSTDRPVEILPDSNVADGNFAIRANVDQAEYESYERDENGWVLTSREELAGILMAQQSPVFRVNESTLASLSEPGLHVYNNGLFVIRTELNSETGEVNFFLVGVGDSDPDEYNVTATVDAPSTSEENSEGSNAKKSLLKNPNDHSDNENSGSNLGPAYVVQNNDQATQNPPVRGNINRNPENSDPQTRVPWEYNYPTGYDPGPVVEVPEPLETAAELALWIGLTLAGAAYALATGVEELVYLSIDYWPQIINNFSRIATGEPLFEYSALSSLGQLIEDQGLQEASIDVGQGILGTPGRIWDSMINGDPFSLGFESLNAILLLEGGVGGFRSLNRLAITGARKIGLKSGTYRLRTAIEAEATTTQAILNEASTAEAIAGEIAAAEVTASPQSGPSGINVRPDVYLHELFRVKIKGAPLSSSYRGFSSKLKKIQQLIERADRHWSGPGPRPANYNIGHDTSNVLSRPGQRATVRVEDAIVNQHRGRTVELAQAKKLRRLAEERGLDPHDPSHVYYTRPPRSKRKHYKK